MTRRIPEPTLSRSTPLTRRGLLLVDLLILVPASACSVLFGITRHVRAFCMHLAYIAQNADGFDPTSGYWWWHLGHSLVGPDRLFEAIAIDSIGILATILIPFSFALILIRLHPPRPDWGRLLCLPGFVATVASTVGLLLIAAGWAYTGRFAPVWVIPATVAVAWSCLAISRRWWWERSWVDRAGRSVGIAWLAMAPFMAWLFRE